eukprot:CAMPEP_0184720006 /NCGR_PEP_ID=MMETSP0314-20130426/9787_1 /TAXON_ID=38298 /ORGANISM="Rhodella maculata, Strain CCMP 736" /LENGTH=96 /DNA_ID=CAMNT_0027183981 /DNA_START=156 /DNA_END=444 /DNA_ORIENTATION=-
MTSSSEDVNGGRREWGSGNVWGGTRETMFHVRDAAIELLGVEPLHEGKHRKPHADLAFHLRTHLPNLGGARRAGAGREGGEAGDDLSRWPTSLTLA